MAHSYAEYRGLWAVGSGLWAGQLEEAMSASKITEAPMRSYYDLHMGRQIR